MQKHFLVKIGTIIRRWHQKWQRIFTKRDLERPNSSNTFFRIRFYPLDTQLSWSFPISRNFTWVKMCKMMFWLFWLGLGLVIKKFRKYRGSLIWVQRFFQTSMLVHIWVQHLIFVPTLKTRCTQKYVSMDACVALLYVLDMDQCCTHKDPLYRLYNIDRKPVSTAFWHVSDILIVMKKKLLLGKAVPLVSYKRENCKNLKFSFYFDSRVNLPDSESLLKYAIQNAFVIHSRKYDKPTHLYRLQP